MTFASRTIQHTILSVEQSEGVGARVRRSIGRSELRNFDPFLLLDEFKVGRPGGFPDHPHRGFETVAYILPWSKGSVEHEDFVGHKGKIGPGDVQWMTAGRGILHSEMPFNKEICHGLQLWINLPSKEKLCKPAYQELTSKDIPKVIKDGVTAAVIAGQALGIESTVYTRTPTHYIHFSLEPNTVLEHNIPKGWASFAYTIEGNVRFGKNGNFISSHNTVTFNSEGDGIYAESGDDGANFVIISGRPIGEKVVQHGPFVMNTEAEIIKAMNDYSSGSGGFENARVWQSEIAKRIN